MLGVEENKKTKKKNETCSVFDLFFFVSQCTCNSTSVFEFENTPMVVPLALMDTLLAFLEGARVPLSLVGARVPLSLVGARVPLMRLQAFSRVPVRMRVRMRVRACARERLLFVRVVIVIAPIVRVRVHVTCTLARFEYDCARR